MKLYLLNPKARLSRNIIKFSKKLGIDTVVQQVSSLDTIIVVANGSPDDIVLCILTYCMNGGKVVGITKPEGRTRFGTFEILKDLLLPKINKILIVLDQEEQKLEFIFQEVERKLQEIGVRAELLNDCNNMRVCAYRCELGHRQFELIIVINGIDNISTRYHTIEDHLVMISEISMKEGETSKDAWKRIKNSLSAQLEVFRTILNFRNRLEEYFPQQIKGLRYLE